MYATRTGQCLVFQQIRSSRDLRWTEVPEVFPNRLAKWDSAINRQSDPRERE